VLKPEEEGRDPWYDIVTNDCVRAVELLGLTTVARVNFRRKTEEENGKFYLFNVNLVPVLASSCLFWFYG
jgi:D-alanine-D-alanine ligase-like ATP-grasp enzyme